MSLSNEIGRKLGVAGVCLLATLGLEGCRHRVVVAPLPPIQTPVELIESAPIPNPPLLEAPPIRRLAEPVAAAAAQPKREKRRSSRAAAVPAPEPAPVATPEPPPPPAETAIGSLTAGDAATPQARQDAADLISSIEKRLNALPAQMSDDAKAQVNKIRNFWRDAQDALKSGDAEGAMTLATKAKLLLDDLEKQ